MVVRRARVSIQDTNLMETPRLSFVNESPRAGNNPAKLVKEPMAREIQFRPSVVGAMISQIKPNSNAIAIAKKNLIVSIFMAHLIFDKRNKRLTSGTCEAGVQFDIPAFQTSMEGTTIPF